MTAPLAACPVAAPIAAPAAAPLALLWSFCCFGACVFCWVRICCGVCIGCGAGVAAGGGPGVAGCVCANAWGPIAVAESAIANVMTFVERFIWPPFRLPLFRSVMRLGSPNDYDPVRCLVDAFSHDSWGYASARPATGRRPGGKAPHVIDWNRERPRVSAAPHQIALGT